MNAEGLATEIPTVLKRMVRLVMRGFYTTAHVVVMDMLIRNTVCREQEIMDVLKFEKRQLRIVMNDLKRDKFVQSKTKLETHANLKVSRQYYFFINYKMFVNVVKYKLYRMRRMIEVKERECVTKATFKCSDCQKTFTNLEVDRIIDKKTGELTCTFCGSTVEEDAIPQPSSRSLLARFNEQMEPLYALIREVENIKFAPEVLQPPNLFSTSENAEASGDQVYKSSTVSWSGDATRKDYYYVGGQHETVEFINPSENSSVPLEKKEMPTWMIHTTIEDEEASSTLLETLDSTKSSADGATSVADKEEIMKALLAHEGKAATSSTRQDGRALNNDSDDDMEVQCDSEEEIITVNVGNRAVPLNDITEEDIEAMTDTEKETYLQRTREIYSFIYE